MTIQITVRIPDDLVEFIDQQVKDGEQSSRAAAVTHALKREQRRGRAEHDALIYATTTDPELDSPEYGQWASANAAKVWADLDDTDWGS